MINVLPYALVLMFSAMALAKGENLKTKDLWYQLGTSLALMLVFRDFILWLRIF